MTILCAAALRLRTTELGPELADIFSSKAIWLNFRFNLSLYFLNAPFSPHALIYLIKLKDALINYNCKRFVCI